ncbi:MULTISPECIES: TonB-dependent receptor [unclassified Arsukibacterium]|uniref:TonB-dependent receptor n=1 Tax=unclassified Arsukibacterium TaxID=2635278 RepID=UPI000C654E36|nr:MULTISPECIES: TonB-dependent receptor [unclassified Arsukibacterium]MAA93307.1 ligand-gated channel protein [Rheinheimera sp.]MBM34201.1 ligand-gated channel protein [Rheinheimera sp.]HAW92201.1 ligand-gated channel protein [Candidatus Azambacteria bacterium]|tara:strand:- start:90447 stop:92768 length:2322 start_codon:yes stop_codon:yes gene_type:complete
MANNYKNAQHKFTRPALKPSLIALAISSCLAAPVFAQQQAVDADEKELKLERIEVTARRTVESLQEVPVAVTSIGADDIAQRGLASIVEVQQFSPNTTLQASRGTNSTLTAFIRGVGQEDPLWGYEPGVGIYIDDVYVARPQGAVLDILNVERIEVLRGPQGTLYGKNTIGGALKYVTREMTGDMDFSVSGTVGSYNQRDVKVTGQIPLIANTLYLGVGYANLQRDGYGEFLISDLPNQDRENYNKDLQALRLTLEYRPVDNLFFRLNYDKTEDDSNAKGGFRLLPSLLTDAPVPDSVYDSYTSMPTENKVETDGISLTASWDINDNFTLKSITSQRTSYSPTNIDFDNTSLRIFDVPAIYDDENFTQELQLNYQTDGFKMVSGLYYYTADSCGVFDAILEVLGQGAFGTPGLTREVGGCSNTDSSAAYAQGSYDLTDKWSITAGLRYTKDEKEATVRNGLIFDTVYPETGWIPGYVRPDGLTTPVVLDDKESWNKLTPKIGIEYQHSRDMMLFASFSQGFKSGTFNPRATVAEPAADPETVNSYEIGMKSDWNDSLRVNATLFMLDHEDRQYISVIPDPDDASALNQRLGNVGKSEATGAELEVTWLASRNLNIYANIGLIDAKFEQALTFDPVEGAVDISDRFTITNTPETTANVGFNYDMMTDFGDVILTGNYAYRSDYDLVELDNLLSQDAYGLLNLGVTWLSKSGQWRVGLHGKNLTDEQYLIGNYAFIAPDPANPGQFIPGLGGDNTLIGYYGAPREVSLTVAYRFW